MSLIVTGIGSRSYDMQTPSTNREILEWIGEMSGVHQWTLRSGGADGMDSAFESVWKGPKEIFIPWAGFNNRNDGINGAVIITDPLILSQTASVAQRIHPAWGRLSRGARALHSRNVNQLKGADLMRNSDVCVYCADVDGSGQVKGGTRTAVMLAEYNQVPTFNIKHTQDRIDLMEYLNEWISSRGDLHTCNEGRSVSPVVF